MNNNDCPNCGAELDFPDHTHLAIKKCRKCGYEAVIALDAHCDDEWEIENPGLTSMKKSPEKPCQ